MCTAPLVLELATPSPDCVLNAVMVIYYSSLVLVCLKYLVHLIALPAFAILSLANALAAKWVILAAVVTAKLKFLEPSAPLDAQLV